jgi:Na+/melibiose symporter-like transporter
MIFVLSKYLGDKGYDGWQLHNVWAIEMPFIIASVLMLVSAGVLIWKIRENKIAEEVKDEMARGELVSEAADKMKADDEGPMTKANKIMLFLILGAEFFWFMADNGIGTFMGNYTIYYLGASTRSNMINTIIGGLGSVIGYAIGGYIAGKIGRKWTIFSGLGLSFISYIIWIIGTFTFLKNAAGSGSFPTLIWVIWFIKGFGMALVHLNSFPMVVELCNSKKIGAFTGYYYASSMAAQTITPIALGSLMLVPSLDWAYLPVYAALCILVSMIIFFFVKNVTLNKTKLAKGLEGLGQDD